MRNEDGVDYFFEGKLVPEEIKQSFYRLENKRDGSFGEVANKSVFESLMTNLIHDLMKKKNIYLTKVERIVNDKVKRLFLYVLEFSNSEGQTFKSAYLADSGRLQYDTTRILTGSIMFTLAKYGCHYCNFSDKNCEFCDRAKIEKIFDPSNKFTLTQNWKEFVDVFGKKTVRCIEDFCQGYFEYMRSTDTDPVEQDDNSQENYKKILPASLLEYASIDEKIIGYVSNWISKILGGYTNNDNSLRVIFNNCSNVEKSFLAIINHLQQLKSFINAIKTNPSDFANGIPDDLEDDFDSVDDEDDEGESWKDNSEENDED